ncbi:FAD dependent oxidoreductase domain containing protein [Naviculisporaceae sp. PSN 640]
MGGVLSSLVGAVKTGQTVIKALRQLSTEFNGILERGRAPPPLPVPNPTTAYWQEQPPFPELIDIRSENLPDTADVVIIGSGITGVAIARSILHEDRRQGRSRRVVVCEARTVCSGATGRNGGHIKASPYEVFGRFRKTLGPERAAALARFQLRHLETFVDLCKAEGIDVAECREVETVDFFLDDESYKSAVEEVNEVNIWVPEFKISRWTAEEAQEKFHANSQVKGAIAYKAGALWPYRLITAVWNTLLDEFPDSVFIETSTAVNEIQTDGSSDYPYILTTSRGQIRTKHVVHATNGYTSRLVPGLQGKATGLLVHMTSQSPGENFPDLNGQRSWSIIYSNGFDYITQRPTVDGMPGKVMLGGGFFLSPKHGTEMIGAYDDSKTDALTNAHNLGIMATVFEPNWGVPIDKEPSMVWSGVMGASADLRPLVGKLDPELTGRKVKTKKIDHGEWISAYFTGDGMVWAWLSGTALGIMISGSENEDLPDSPGRPAGKLADWFPSDLLPTVKRVKAMDLTNLAEEFS